MSFFADTSFLCALYREQDNNKLAESFITSANNSIHLSSLVVFEFRQSVRLQAFRFASDRSQVFSKRVADTMLALFDENFANGTFVIPIVNWVDVHSLAERLSAKHTFTQGHRTMDMLHIATALHLKIKTFISFDQKQAALAKKEGFHILPRTRPR
ncbi:MAG: type II toxin-antitoxin system VapC family toxin [Chthoniobacterales bacterium]|nr:type II toxin-antitoxin system VapC family toxin [Chthoniobacterales bacterium]